MNHYPTADELSQMGAPLERDVTLCNAELQRWWGRAQSSPIYTRSEPEPKRTYASAYVGVSVYKERWYISSWTVAGKAKRGHLRPRTPEGEKWSAQDRARGLGREYLEMRDGTHTPYLWKAYEEMAA